MKIEGDDLIFSTGRKVYANYGIVGISPRLGVTGGYDQGFDGDLLPAERIELADYMIGQWLKFKSQAQKPEGGAT
jgi:hypothetical protein